MVETLTLTPDEPAIGGMGYYPYGRSTKTGESEWTLPVNMVGHGIGGSIDGMHLRVTNTIVYNVPFGFWLGNVEGYIKFNEINVQINPSRLLIEFTIAASRINK
ncbi:MAG: hypothetical protein MZV64_36585 [Ignavibacteriales bacterium]|nr:hypothetical protein [Ignavibacteriales bacterium]